MGATVKLHRNINFN